MGVNYSGIVKHTARSSNSYTGAVSHSVVGGRWVRDIFVHIDALPASSEPLTIKLLSGSGSTHLLHSVDPSVSTGSTWDLWFQPSQLPSLVDGDSIIVEYTNTDANTVDVLVHYEDQ